MALVLVEGFEGLQTSDLEKKSGYSNSGCTVDTSNGRRAGRCLQSGFATQYFTMSFSALSTVYCGFAAWIPTNFDDSTNTSYSFAGFRNVDSGGSGYQIRFIINSLKRLCVYRGSTLLGESTLLIYAGWNYFEFQVTAHSSTGAVLVYVNGIEHLNLTGQNTLSTGSTNSYNALRIAANGSGGDYYFDDLWIDNAGLLGDCRIDVLSPSGAGATTQWTPSTGSNYACVDEIPGSATDYVSSSTLNQTDTYAFGNLSALSSTIYATVLNAMIKKTDAGSRGISPVTRSGGTDYVGTETSPTTSDLYMTEIRETDPNTAAAWGESGVNAAEFGVKLTT